MTLAVLRNSERDHPVRTCAATVGDRPSVLRWTVCPFSVESVFEASLMHEIARIWRAARQLTTEAPQLSSRMRAVFVSAGWLSRTEVVKMSPARGYMGMPSFGTGDRLWDVDLL